MTNPIFAEIQAEREAQDRQWGGPAHDDQRHPMEWFRLILDQNNKTMMHHRRTIQDVRSRYVKIAALAVAGIASIDRRIAGEEK